MEGTLSILERGKSRDYYDVWRLLAEKRAAFDAGLARETLRAKCQHKGLPYPTTDDFLAPERLAEAQQYWGRDLQEHVANLPKFPTVVETLRRLLENFLA